VLYTQARGKSQQAHAHERSFSLIHFSHKWPTLALQTYAYWLPHTSFIDQAFGDQLKATETVAPRSATVSVAHKNSSEGADSQRPDLTSKIQLAQQNP
jgi:hypothetical protein